ncbi:DUF5624 domain-containing protein [Paraburkholderia sediminicola]|uniref:DUF5624 domain-containing protein n=1 Tax=Paraburkholderia sediminicola TaxID=458836 RepID=UPI0038B6F4A1
MAYQPDPVFQGLYDAYTGQDSTGQHLTRHMVKMTEQDPILVVTGSDFVFFPGLRQPPIVQSFRRSTKGFIELTSISHLGPALAWLFRLRDLGYASWRQDAERILKCTDEARKLNSESYWTDVVAVEAYKGYERKIADMIDYSCEVTTSFLSRCLADESLMTFEYLREGFLEPSNKDDVAVPINDMMVATFSLTFLDIGQRVIQWLRSQNFDWSKLMVLLSGKSGRPTAGLTWPTNNNCHLLFKASREQLPVENVQIAPHGPSMSLEDIGNQARIDELEQQFRNLFLHIRANIDLSRLMFEGFPSFKKSIEEPPVIEPGTSSLSAMPRLRSTDDRLTAITRLRFVMEDPTQLLSNSVAHFIIDQLCDHDNNPAAVVIPGFTNVTYPPKRA